MNPIPMVMMLATLLSAPLLDGKTQSGPTIDRQNFRQAIHPGQPITILNANGDLRLRSGDPDQVEVHAVIQNLDPGSPAPRLTVRSKNGVTLIETLLEEPPSSKPDRIDLVVYAPPGSAIEAQTKHGLIEIKGVKSDVSAESMSGEISIRDVQGRIQVRSDNGPVLAILMPEVTNLPQEFITITGDITLYFPENGQASIEATTSGEITTDYSIQIEFDGTKEPDKVGTSILGKGGAMVRAASKRGDIRLFRLIKTLRKAKEPSKDRD